MSSLYAKLQEIGGIFATLNQSKLSNIIQLSCCILKSRSCNLQKCRDELSGVTGELNLKQDTAYARLKRVFQTGAINPILKTVFLFTLYLLKPSGRILLIVDRTDFQIGPIQLREFDSLKVWWHNRQANEQAWKVGIQTIMDSGYNLDVKNPHQPEEEQTYTSAELLAMLHQSFTQNDDLLSDVKKVLNNV